MGVSYGYNRAENLNVYHTGRELVMILVDTVSRGGNLLLDTRCNYYDQNYEWRKGINFCLKKDGDICWVAPSSPKSRSLRLAFGE